MPRKRNPPALPTVKRLLRAVNNDPTQYDVSQSDIRSWSLLAGIFETPNKFTPEDMRAIIAAIKGTHGDTDRTRRIARAWEPFTHEPDDRDTATDAEESEDE